MNGCRRAKASVAIEAATSGNITFFDDPRWVFQEKARALFGKQGTMKPETSTLREGNWVNVDDRLGYAVVGSHGFYLFAVPGQPCIWRGNGTMYNTCRLEFVHVARAAEKPVPVSFDAGERISRFGMLSCPGQTKEETAALACRMVQAGWQTAEDQVLALMLDRYLVYANFSSDTKAAFDGRQTIPLAPKTSGWVTRGRPSESP